MTDPTPEERARTAYNRWRSQLGTCIVGHVTDEIRAAVEAEREACAKVAQEYVYNTFASTEEEWRGAAAAIRAREDYYR